MGIEFYGRHVSKFDQDIRTDIRSGRADRKSPLGVTKGTKMETHPYRIGCL